MTSIAHSTTADQFDIAILGSGFSGSLVSLILQKSGMRTVMIDRARHPRFAIGESSTPAANLILRSLAEEHGLPELASLSRFGTWRKKWPDMRCGLKRGFSYFAHHPGEAFATGPNDSNQLLVAASISDEVGDTQWYRADVDSFLAGLARNQGAILHEGSRILSATRQSSGWSIRICNGTSEFTVSAGFIVDASGAGQALVECGGVHTEPALLRTRTRAIFAHARLLPKWSDVLEITVPGGTARHPFRCDDSAMHHILEEGWMWWLRFHDGLTSVGLVLDESRRRFDADVPVQREWDTVLARYPSLKHAFRYAELAQPKPVPTGIIQWMNRNVAGSGWALLPSTAGFVDPLHSTGIAHALSGVERLVRILIRNPSEADRNVALQEYGRSVVRELEWIDTLVHGCYQCLSDFRKFTAFSMCYFAAATTYERRRLEMSRGDEPAFLCADDDGLTAAVVELAEAATATSEVKFESLCKLALRPFNHVSLFSPRHPNMYDCTALPE